MQLFLLSCLLVSGSRAQELTSTQTQISSLSAQNAGIRFALEPNMTQWQGALLATPTVVKLIGQMVVISSKVDVSLADQEPLDGWKFADNPSSLRASLIQVANEGWNAFHVAHSNMDHISLSMIQVPRHVKTALRVIKLVEFEQLPGMLAIPLKSIEKVGDRCVELAVNTSRSFYQVMGLTGELSVAVAASQGKHDVLIVEAEAQKEAAKTQKRLMDEQKKFMLERYEEQKKVTVEARAAYERAIKKIPTGFKAFAMDLFTACAPSIIGAAMGVPSFSGSFGGGGGGGGNGNGQSNSPNASRDIHDPVILQTMRTVAEKLPQMQEYINQALGEAGDAGMDEVKNFFTTMRAIFEETVARFSSYPNTPLKMIADKALGTLLKISEGLESRLTDMALDVTEENKAIIMGKVDEVAGELATLIAAGIVTGDTSGVQLPQRGGGGGRGGGAGANERFIAESRLQNLQGSEDRLESVYRDIAAFNQELTEVEVRLSQIDLRRLNLEQVRELLRQVLSILGRIRELWSTLVRFFTIIANRAKVLNTDFLQPFVDMSRRIGATTKSDEDRIRNNLIKLLREQALDINVVSHLLHTVSKTYVRVSSEHVLGKLAGVAKLLAARDDDERQRWKEELDTDATAASADIMAVIRGTKEKYGAEVLATRRRLETAIAEWGGIPTADQAHIDAGVQMGNDVILGTTTIQDDVTEDPWSMDDLLS